MSINPRRYAFPMPSQGSIPGMLLRDYFATQALAGLLASPHIKVEDNEQISSLPRLAYDFADAMLVARSEGAAE